MKEFLKGYSDAMEKAGWMGFLGYVLLGAIAILGLIAMLRTVLDDVVMFFRDKRQTTFGEAMSINQYKVYHLLVLIYYVPVWIIDMVIICLYMGLKYILTRPITKPKTKLKK